MWFCADCGEAFMDPVKTMLDDDVEEDTCPLCGSDDIEDEGYADCSDIDDDETWDDYIEEN
jgi:hypothetical protein